MTRSVPPYGGGGDILVERGDLGDAHQEASFAVLCGGEVAEAGAVRVPQHCEQEYVVGVLWHQLGSAAGAWQPQRSRSATLVGGRGRLHAA